MADQERLIPAQLTSTVIKSCWICGIRLPAERMIADGGSACADVRWYCRDMRACTERWTARPAAPAEAEQSAASPRPARLVGLTGRR
jgi:hypothetical protein